MQVSHFPAAAANSLIEGYCDDFVSLAAVLSQTLEQVSMRGINIAGSTPALTRIENGMRALAEAIHELLERLPAAPTGPRAEAPPVSKPTPAQAAAQPSSTRAAASPRPQPVQQQPNLSPRPPQPSLPPAAAEPPHQAPPAPPPPAPSARPSTGAPRRAATDPDAPGTLRGTNNSMPLLSVFQFLERTRKSGVLTVELPGETIRFGVASGCVRSCLSSAPVAGERVGDLVVSAGIADSEIVEAAMRKISATKAPRDGRKLGDLLVQQGVLTNGQLQELLEDQTRQRFRRACATHTASYAFAAAEPESTDGRVQIAPTELNHRPSFGRSS
ncbi:MAG: DUF4388 domain-containing protein [Planctomycetota bacterium]